MPTPTVVALFIHRFFLIPVVIIALVFSCRKAWPGFVQPDPMLVSLGMMKPSKNPLGFGEVGPSAFERSWTLWSAVLQKAGLLWSPLEYPGALKIAWSHPWRFETLRNLADFY